MHVLAPPAITFELMPPSGRREAAVVWQALEARHGAAVTCSWAWTSTWLDHYGDLVPHAFALGVCDGDPCAAALVTRGVGQRLGPVPLPTLHLGTAGEPPGEGVFVEPNGFVADPEVRDSAVLALVDLMRRQRAWAELRFEALPPDEAAAVQSVDRSIVARREICRVTDLAAAREGAGTLLPTLAGRSKTLRASARRLAPVCGTWARSSGEALEILDELIELHQRRWHERGQAGAFASPRACAFHRALVTRTFESGAVVLFRASTAAGTLGCEYALVDGNRVLSYQRAMAGGPVSKHSPGMVTSMHFIEACLQRGYDEFDLLAGDSAYKRALSDSSRELAWLTMRRPSPAWALADAAARTRRTWRARGGGARRHASVSDR